LQNPRSFGVADEKEALIETTLQFKQIGFMSMGSVGLILYGKA
jgi:hypothetical protein